MKRLAVLSLLFALVGCVPVVQPEPPKIELLSFELVQLDPFAGAADFNLRLKLTNPNGFPLPLQESTLTAELAGVGFGMNLYPLDLAAGASRETTARLSVPVTQGANALAVLVSGKPTRFRLMGAMNARIGPAVIPIGPFTFVNREVSVGQLFRLPTLRLGEFRLEGLTLRASLEVQNPSPIGYSLLGPLRLSIGGRSVAEARFNMRVAPAGVSRGEVAFGLTGFPGVGALVVEANLVASIPGILQSPVAQILQGGLR